MTNELKKLTGGRGLPVFIDPADGEVSISGAEVIVPSPGTVFTKLTAVNTSAEDDEVDVLAQMKLDGSKEITIQTPIPCNGDALFTKVQISAGQIAVYFKVG